MGPEQRRFSVRYGAVAIVALLLIEAFPFAPHPESALLPDPAAHSVARPRG